MLHYTIVHGTSPARLGEAARTAGATPDEHQLRLFSRYLDWGSIVEHVGSCHRISAIGIRILQLYR